MTRKAKFIISDTHLGAGLYEAGNVLEDFISDADFTQWVHDLIAESERDGVEMELIINGDFLEMLQVPAVPSFDPLASYPPEVYAPSHEAACVQKMRHVVDGHPAVFASMADFLQLGPPRRSVTIIKGNHDPDLYWPGVQDVIRQAIGARGDLADLLTFPPVALQREGLYVEHGNQYTERINRYRDFAKPLDPERPGELERVPGSRFVYEFFNSLERERPWIDGVSPLTALIWYALQFDPGFALLALATLLPAAPGLIAGELGFRAATPEMTEAASLLNDLATPEQQAVVSRRLAEDPEFQAAFYRRVEAALETTGLEERPPSRAAPDGELDPFRVAQDIQRRYTDALVAEAERKAAETGALVVSFGHTHRPVVRQLSNGGVYVNSGTWVWRGDFAGADREVWRDLFENPTKYSEYREPTYVRVDYDEEGRPRAGLHLLSRPTPEPRPPAQERIGCLEALKRLLTGG
ncbi:MAG: hypothetical protein GXP39_12470 [Chloroflexi bacterium]|nr:hypothetical protein [Chloroflexota bacterium]